MLQLYEIHDNPEGYLCSDEVTWDAIWAHSAEEAEAMYRKRYESETGLTPEEYGVKVKAAHPSQWLFSYAPDHPKREGRTEVLRYLGWSCEGESACEECEQYAMDDDRFRPCYECGNCPECGHAEDCSLSGSASARDPLDTP